MDPLPAELRELYPFESHYHEVEGARMHYVDEGSGPAVVMLHGNPTWSFYYRDLIKSLRDRYRVIAPDHIGCGLSDKPAAYPYALPFHIENVHSLIGHLGLRDVTLVLHDWGGAIGMGWAVRNRSKVRRFVVLNTAAFLGGRMPRRIAICRVPLLGALLVRGLNGFARAALTMATAKPDRMTPAVKRGYLWPYDSWANRVAIHEFVRDIPVSSRDISYDVMEMIEAALPSLADRPMAIYWGGRDFCFTDAFLAEWTRRFPRAELHRFPDCGHYVVEDAHPRLTNLMRDFLERTDGGT